MQNDRARQFMPFNSLNGYYDMIDDASKIYVPKRDLTADEENELNMIVPMLEKGMVISIVFYHEDGYVTKEGIISVIDFTMKYLVLVKTKIIFVDILSIKILQK